MKKHEWEKPVRAKKERRCPTTARKVARRRKSKKNPRGGEKDGNRHRCAEVGVKKRGYDWALPRVMQTTFYLLQKQAGGRRSANKHHIQNLVARNIFFPPMQVYCLAARLISLQSHLIFSLICDSSKSCVFCHPRSHPLM